MISVILPTLNNGATLAPVLSALIPAAVQGVVREVIVVDAGSSDQTLKIADGCGAITLEHAGPPSTQCLAAVQSAKFPWVLLLSPDIVLDVGWEREVDQFIQRVETQKITAQAAVFPLVLDVLGWRARLSERLIGIKTWLSGRAHPNQGLLIQRDRFTAISQTGDRFTIATLRSSALLQEPGLADTSPLSWVLRQYNGNGQPSWMPRARRTPPARAVRQQPASS